MDVKLIPHSRYNVATSTQESCVCWECRCIGICHDSECVHYVMSYMRRPRASKDFQVMALEPTTIDAELEILIQCIRTSAQETLDSLHRKGWKIVRA